ncbi:MAG: DoxX family protein [Prolixibacteraceae bacterium]|nr:DoxX family protein [Prolixibacteraceae bacterium]
MKVIKHIARILLGITFVFSGFVKGIDPWGSTYKFTDYFNAMGMEWLLWAAFPLGVLLSLAEFTIGIALIFNVFIRFFSWLALLFMAVFLPVTLWIAIKNPVTDCGCFGDALVISNWETFYKNVVLTVLAIIVVRWRKNMECLFNQKIANALSIASIIVYCITVYYSYNHLPILDFRPYKVGVNIPEAMTVPEGAPQDVYENIFYYENKNTGKIKKFSEDNYPWQDTLNWKYSDMESKLIQEGYVPPIHDFSIETPDGENVIDFFIYDENYVFMLIAYNLENSNREPQEKINNLANWALNEGLSFICLTSTLPDESAAFANETGAPYEFFNCDEITLKTIVRANPGLVVMKEGTIMGKWHYNDIPTPEEFMNEFRINEVE